MALAVLLYCINKVETVMKINVEAGVATLMWQAHPCVLSANDPWRTAFITCSIVHPWLSLVNPFVQKVFGIG